MCVIQNQFICNNHTEPIICPVQRPLHLTPLMGTTLRCVYCSHAHFVGERIEMYSPTRITQQVKTGHKGSLAPALSPLPRGVIF
jgi:hypothetical protein